ncbi:MAG TPA: glycoside hydrolase family 99-like domain-containing protein, partial [Candidatus Saccharimonadales bacterium]|nr:glycoside hydrolase family 99-like domain-containing protein [Candidatus Saccharimonadales bacterium]
FSRSNYWRIDGKPYFSIYEANTFVSNFGSVANARAALDQIRAKAKAAGLPGLHLNAVDWACDSNLARELGFDSITAYVWVHHADLPEQQTEYNFVRDEYFDFWTKARASYGVPYIPNVTMGWDPSPRADQSQAYGNFGYPFTNILKDNTPENFQTALEMAKQRLLAETNGLRILNLNCWNEWTEGSYLEPDTVHGMAYLDAVEKVFGEGR